MKLTREPQDGKQTLGKLDFEGYELVTIELAWNDNKRGESCIPPGKYKAIPRTSKKFGNHFIILDTSPREYVLFHPANYSRELRGCIAPGMSHKDIDKDGLKDVTESKKAMTILLEKFPKGFELEIVQLKNKKSSKTK